MPTVGADQATPGMVLANPITDRRGRLLIPAGQALSDKHVNALKMWGIVSLDIEGDEEPEVVVHVSPAALEAARAEQHAHYRHADLNHPFMSQLFEHRVQQRAREIGMAPAITSPQDPTPNSPGEASVAPTAAIPAGATP